MPFTRMKSLVRLSIPIVATYLGVTAMSLVDLLFVGKVSSEAIGAVGVGTSLFNWFIVFGIGLSSGMDFLVSRAHGARELWKKHHYLSQGLLLALGSAVPMTGLLALISFHLEWFGINPEVLPLAKSYSVLLSSSLVFTYLCSVFRIYLTAFGVAQGPMMVLILSNILNAILNDLLVLGHLGFPAMGVVGSAWATWISRAVMMFGMMGFVLYYDRSLLKIGLSRFFKYRPEFMAELLRLGVPAALQMILEVGVFSVSTALAARLTASELAAHQIVLNTVSITFMVPMGVGAASAVLVGRAVGERNSREAVSMGWRGFILGVGFMLLSALILLGFPKSILGFFTHDSQVISVGKSILWVGALFQLSDGIQTVGTGVLRGLGDTKSAMFFNFCGHWIVGLPMGLLLCFKGGWGLAGLWTGLSLGLTVVASGVFAKWWLMSRKLVRVQAEVEKTF